MSIRLERYALCIAAMFLGLEMGAACAQNEIFVDNAGNNSVTVYSRTGNGNVAPLRTISGAATGLNSPEGLTVDTVNNEIFVANDFPANGTVNVYGLTAVGNVAPLRTISGATTAMDTPRGIVVDTVNNELIVVQVSTPAITVYARTANGNVAPLRTISGAATGLVGPIGVSVDTANNEIAVANISGNSITVYSRTANGNVAPLRTISGAATSISTPESVVIDPVNNELSVTNFSTPSITVYSRTATGNAAPLRTITGAATGLSRPVGIALDGVNNELLVTNVNINTVTAYSRTATGNAAPLRTIAGAATGLSSPAFLAVTTGAAVGSPLAITTTSPLPAGTVGTPYSQTFAATGGTPTYAGWVLIAGSLPTGLTLNAGTGTLTGTPGTSGTFNFTVQVTDSAQGTTTKAFSLTINAVVVVTPALPIPALGNLAVALLALLLAMGAAVRLRKD